MCTGPQTRSFSGTIASLHTSVPFDRMQTSQTDDLSVLFFQSAIVDYKESKERRHGARITPQAERPIPAWEGLEL